MTTTDPKYQEICDACGRCDGTLCAALRKKGERTQDIKPPLSQTYGTGLRISSDSFDCAIPISMDQHSGCSYNCLYCFSNNLSRGIDRKMALSSKDCAASEGIVQAPYSEWPIRRLEQLLGGDMPPSNRMGRAAQLLLRQGAPMQWGGLGDPFDEIERATGWALKALPIFHRYGTPVRISTKGADVLLTKKYQKAFDEGPRQFWFAFSIITANDSLITSVDLAAPNASKRLKAMKKYSDMGFKCSLRLRPFIPYISDKWPGEPEGWRILLERAAESGANAISFEWVFLAQSLTARQRAMYRLWFRESGHPEFGEWYTSISDRKQACRRGSRVYKYDLTMKIIEKTHELGMTFGCSDPHFKEFGDTGCCCGIQPDDPVFGKWSRHQLSHLVIEGRKAWERGEQKYYTWKDMAPSWAKLVRLEDMVLQTGKQHEERGVMTWYDHLHNKWNNPKHPRAPFWYFSGLMRPCGVDSRNDVIYKYEPWTPGAENPRLLRRGELLKKKPSRIIKTKN